MVDEGDEVQRIEADLRRTGRADHVSLERALLGWYRLSIEVNSYPATVDDYTNDLCSRDYLAALASRASSGLRRQIGQRVALADESFRQATVEDAEASLGRYYRIASTDGWWWRRRPAAGPLADFLAIEEQPYPRPASVQERRRDGGDDVPHRRSPPRHQ